MKKNGFKLTKKGIIALAVLIILLAGAIWLNIRLNGENPADGAARTEHLLPAKTVHREQMFPPSAAMRIFTAAISRIFAMREILYVHRRSNTCV